MIELDNWIIGADHEPRQVPWDEWVEWTKAGWDQRRVAKTTVGESDVSTVFLSIDHNFLGGGRPVLFETMVFGGPLDQSQWRYHTWAEAEAGHAAVVAAIEAGVTDPDSVPL